MKLSDLLDVAMPQPSLLNEPPMNPLVEADALREAQVLDILISAAAGAAGVIFELRQALQLREANTGVLIVRGLRECSWSAASAVAGEMRAWGIESSTPQALPGSFRISLSMWPSPGATLTIASSSAEFYLVDIADLDSAPLDYSSNDLAAIRRRVARWDSEARLVCAMGSAAR